MGPFKVMRYWEIDKSSLDIQSTYTFKIRTDLLFYRDGCDWGPSMDDFYEFIEKVEYNV